MTASFPLRSFQVETGHRRDDCQWNQSLTWRRRLMRWWHHWDVVPAAAAREVAMTLSRVAGCRSRRNLCRCLPSETAAGTDYLKSNHNKSMINRATKCSKSLQIQHYILIIKIQSTANHCCWFVALLTNYQKYFSIISDHSLYFEMHSIFTDNFNVLHNHSRSN